MTSNNETAGWFANDDKTVVDQGWVNCRGQIVTIAEAPYSFWIDNFGTPLHINFAPLVSPGHFR